VSLLPSRLDNDNATLDCLLARLLEGLQSVQITWHRWSLVTLLTLVWTRDSTSNDLHWLRSHGTNVSSVRTCAIVLVDELQRVANIESRPRQQSVSTTALVVPCPSHSTIGDRTLPVAAARVWNSFTQRVTSSVAGNHLVRFED